MIKPRNSYTVLRRRNLVIDCQSEGIPPPTHQWKKSSRTVLGMENNNNGGGGGMVPDESDSSNDRDAQEQQRQPGQNGFDTINNNNNNGGDFNGLSGSDTLIAIVSGPHIHVLENGSLAIIDSNKSDEGEYYCEA